MFNIARVHYINQELSDLSIPEQIDDACEGGAKWVQLRIKELPVEEVKYAAFEALRITDHYFAQLIINDHPDVARKIGASGVHLGKEDMDPVKARKLVGSNFIIGGTGNTFEDILKLAEAEVNYIGLGPFRFTSTKKNLSPVLGVEGYEKIMEQCEKAGISIPVIAIGGIKVEDIPGIMKAGCYGIAVSSGVNLVENRVTAMRGYIEEINKRTKSQDGVSRGRTHFD